MFLYSNIFCFLSLGLFNGGVALFEISSKEDDGCLSCCYAGWFLSLLLPLSQAERNRAITKVREIVMKVFIICYSFQ
jgi:hypothetical protein